MNSHIPTKNTDIPNDSRPNIIIVLNSWLPQWQVATRLIKLSFLFPCKFLNNFHFQKVKIHKVIAQSPRLGGNKHVFSSLFFVLFITLGIPLNAQSSSSLLLTNVLPACSCPHLNYGDLQDFFIRTFGHGRLFGLIFLRPCLTVARYFPFSRCPKRHRVENIHIGMMGRERDSLGRKQKK